MLCDRASRSAILLALAIGNGAADTACSDLPTSGDPAARSGLFASTATVGEAAGTWTVAADNVQALGYQTATVLADGRVLALGGQETKAELFNPVTGAWSAAASMKQSRAYTTATLLRDGKVLVVGGYDGSSPLASAELYDPQTNQWTLTGSMTTARLLHIATLLDNGKVLVAGGRI